MQGMSEPNPCSRSCRGAGTCPGQTEHESHAVLHLVARLVQPLLALDNLGIAFANTSDGGPSVTLESRGRSAGVPR